MGAPQWLPFHLLSQFFNRTVQNNTGVIRLKISYNSWWKAYISNMFWNYDNHSHIKKTSIKILKFFLFNI